MEYIEIIRRFRDAERETKEAIKRRADELKIRFLEVRDWGICHNAEVRNGNISAQNLLNEL